MTSVNRAIHTKATLGSPWRRIGTFCLSDWRISAYSLVLFSLFLVIVSNLAHGDDSSTQSQNDPKDLIAYSAPASQPTGGVYFLPLPGWSHGAVMPPLPDKLKPMGKQVVLVTPPIPKQASLTPPKETPPAPQETVAKAKPTPPPAPAEASPALIAVSPFLQWIKANPQAAAAEARQQANSYHAPSAPDTSSAGTTTAPASGATSGSEDTYWLPPLLDNATFGPQPVTGSAAIYSTPQR